jgi:hypothetical protein
VVSAFSELSATLTPQTSESTGDAEHTVTLENGRNHAVSVNVAATDPNNRLRLELQPAQLTLEPGQRKTVRLRVGLRHAADERNDQRRPFQVVVRPDEGAPITLEAATVLKAPSRLARALPLWRWLLAGGVALAAAIITTTAIASVVSHRSPPWGGPTSARSPTTLPPITLLPTTPPPPTAPPTTPPLTSLPLTTLPTTTLPPPPIRPPTQTPPPQPQPPPPNPRPVFNPQITGVSTTVVTPGQTIQVTGAGFDCARQYLIAFQQNGQQTIIKQAAQTPPNCTFSTPATIPPAPTAKPGAAFIVACITSQVAAQGPCSQPQQITVNA